MKTHKVRPLIPFYLLLLGPRDEPPGPLGIFAEPGPSAVSLSLVCVCVCREGVGEAVPGDGEGQDRAAVRREAAPARQEEHQAQEEALQDGMLLFLSSSLVLTNFLFRC